MAETILHLSLAFLGIAAGCLSGRLPVSGKAAVLALGLPGLGYFFAWVFC
ncbi:MAG: hypothetical protein HYY24_10225 [Verrucomicrobia bacterium]|nr:hypothetical protein [Verrucomicrobiota bacterium]